MCDPATMAILAFSTMSSTVTADKQAKAAKRAQIAVDTRSDAAALLAAQPKKKTKVLSPASRQTGRRTVSY